MFDLLVTDVFLDRKSDRQYKKYTKNYNLNEFESHN